VVVVNVREADEPHYVATTFISTYSLKREYFKILFTNVQKVKDHWTKNKNPNDCLIRNMIVKDFKFQAREGEYGMKENVPFNSRTGKSPSKSPIKNSDKPKVLFKLNFDTGNGRISKITVREGENLSK
jgi:hypothetical protein